jgi:hypothetical protein
VERTEGQANIHETREFSGDTEGERISNPEVSD